MRTRRSKLRCRINLNGITGIYESAAKEIQKGVVQMGRIFGTFGVRGVFPEKMNPEFVYRLLRAYGTYLKRKVRNPVVGLGRDTRLSGETLKNAAVSALVESGVNVVDFGMVPTPAVQFGCRKLNLDGGVVITASHNPPEFNGVKLLEGNGMGLKRENEKIVEDIFFEESFEVPTWKDLGKVSQYNVKDEYINEIVRRVDKQLINSVKPKILVDMGNGAGAFTLPYVLEELGCRILSINAHPSGRFSWRNPEPNEENLKTTVEIVRSVDVDFAVAQDGDADRAVFINEYGEFIQGDRTFALAEREVLKRKKGTVVTTVATSLVIDDVAKEFGVDVVRTKVGDLVVTGELLKRGGVVGGEENGGVIFPDFVLGRDGAMTTALIVEAFTRSGKSFSKLLEELPYYYQIKTKIHMEGD
ncbi:MAG: phosphoglucosamine mutase [Thermotogaceae bacterium]|nr:phosphoglucosamine mutase [Thermotogaceae bacterium]